MNHPNDQSQMKNIHSMNKKLTNYKLMRFYPMAAWTFPCVSNEHLLFMWLEISNYRVISLSKFEKAKK